MSPKKGRVKLIDIFISPLNRGYELKMRDERFFHWNVHQNHSVIYYLDEL
jgi:hypothetical protein